MFSKLRKNALFTAALAGNYRFALPFFRLFKKRYPRLANSSTELCIEGFPRSGNTYFVSALLLWNSDTRIAHHSHLGSSVKYALKRGTPTVLLIRDPADCVASVLAWDGLLTSAVALANYVQFYRQLWKHRDRYLVACIQLINDRFGMTFKWEQFNDRLDQHIRARLEKVDHRNNRSAVNSALPNQMKLEMKQAFQHKLVNSWLYSPANTIYSSYKILAVRPDHAETKII